MGVYRDRSHNLRTDADLQRYRPCAVVDAAHGGAMGGGADAAERRPVIGAQEPKRASNEARPTAGVGTPAATPERRGRGSGWATYRNTRFHFALRYPADV